MNLFIRFLDEYVAHQFLLLDLMTFNALSILFEFIPDSSAQAAYLPDYNVWSVTPIYTSFIKTTTV